MRFKVTNSFPLALSSWDKNELDAINNVIDSGMYSMGKYVEQFEKDFAKYLNVPYCVMCNSGSSANLLGIASLFYKKENKLKAGDEVIVPAVSWATTYFPLYQYGLKLKFVDIDKDTLNFDLDKLSTAITDETKVILAVNLLGNPNDFNKIKSLIGNNNIYLFEDNCESLGATFENQMTGTFGDIGTFSTFFSHHISTMEGGIVAVYDEELYHILLSLRAHGWTRNLPDNNKVSGKKSDIHFEESWKFVLPGYNMRPVEMSGAIGIEQLKKLPSFIDERRKNATYFQEMMSNNKYFSIQKEIGSSSWFGFSLVLKEDCPLSRNEIVEHLENNNIDCRPIVAGNFVNNPVVDYMNYTVHGALDNADYITKNGFMVGNHHIDLKGGIDYLVTTLNGLF